MLKRTTDRGCCCFCIFFIFPVGPSYHIFAYHLVEFWREVEAGVDVGGRLTWWSKRQASVSAGLLSACGMSTWRTPVGTCGTWWIYRQSTIVCMFVMFCQFYLLFFIYWYIDWSHLLGCSPAYIWSVIWLISACMAGMARSDLDQSLSASLSRLMIDLQASFHLLYIFVHGHLLLYTFVLFVAYIWNVESDGGRSLLSNNESSYISYIVDDPDGDWTRVHDYIPSLFCFCRRWSNVCRLNFWIMHHGMAWLVGWSSDLLLLCVRPVGWPDCSSNGDIFSISFQVHLWLIWTISLVLLSGFYLVHVGIGTAWRSWLAWRGCACAWWRTILLVLPDRSCTYTWKGMAFLRGNKPMAGHWFGVCQLPLI